MRKEEEEDDDDIIINSRARKRKIMFNSEVGLQFVSDKGKFAVTIPMDENDLEKLKCQGEIEVSNVVMSK